MFIKKSKPCVVFLIKKYSTKVKQKIEVNAEIENKIENGLFKPKKHPGVFKPRTIHLPEEFITAAEKALADYPVRQLLDDSKNLVNYMKSRKLPVEPLEFISTRTEIENKLLLEYPDVETLNGEELNDLKTRIKPKVTKILKTKLYSWKPIDFDIYTCLQYLLSRSAPEYAALYRIFQEIQRRDNDFKPKTLFDFGSGVGTGTWAAKQFWKKSIFEYFNVDCSVHMNDLALILLKGGTGVRESNITGVYYRQFLPATNISFDLVLSAYSLLELPSSRVRLETVLNLWNKTQKYLVIVERGSNAGFQVVNEARDFILQLNEDPENSTKGYVFSPCPHDKMCPKFMTEPVPCNFKIGYMTIPIGQKSDLYYEYFSYVVLKKGERNNESDHWPRLVQPTLVRSKHSICRMCTASGKLEEVIFSASKHGQTIYRCARGSDWGDTLPVNLIKTQVEEEPN